MTSLLGGKQRNFPFRVASDSLLAKPSKYCGAFIEKVSPFVPEKTRKSRWLVSPILENPRASYRAENPTNPKIGQKYQPDIQIPPTAGDRKNTPKIPEKYPKNTNFSYFFSIPGGIWRGISGSLMFCMLGGIFAFRWLSYSVAGRGVVNPSPTNHWNVLGYHSSKFHDVFPHNLLFSRLPPTHTHTLRCQQNMHKRCKVLPQSLCSERSFCACLIKHPWALIKARPYPSHLQGDPAQNHYFGQNAFCYQVLLGNACQ